MKFTKLQHRWLVCATAVCLELIPRALIRTIRGDFYFSNYSKATLARLKQEFDSSDDRRGKYVLLDAFPLPHWVLLNGIVAQQLNEKFGTQSATFDFSNRVGPVEELFNAAGIKNHLRIRLDARGWARAIFCYINVIRWIGAGHKLIDLELNGVNIGLDIYESVLRRGHATVDYTHIDTYRELWRGVKQYYFFLPKFENKLIAFALLSHDNYVGPGLLSRIAFNYGVPVILANPFEIDIVTKPFELYERFQHYPRYFDALTEAKKDEFLSEAKKYLKMRIEGEVGIGTMRYQILSAFNSQTLPRQTSNSTRSKVLVLAHDFFDNPHGYRKMPFDDFLDWLYFIAEVAEVTDHEWYIKIHRDYSEIEHAIISQFVDSHPKFVLLSPDVSYGQLYREGIRHATTCFGSAGHELPLLNFTVINASYNPHVSYDFNLHAHSRDEYKKFLIELPTLELNSERLNQLYEFYVVHTFLMWPDSFNFTSYADFNQYVDGDLTSDKAVGWLLDNFAEIKNRTLANLASALEFGRKFSVESGLPPEMQQKIELPVNW